MEMIRFLIAGLLMGIANLIPGVSGGTIAVITGVFERLIFIINEFVNLRFTKKNILTLFVLALGVILSILLFSNLMNYALKNYAFYTYTFFFGLIAGSITSIEKNVSESNLWYRLFGFALVVIPSLLKSGYEITFVSFGHLPLIFFMGFIAGGSMILPGLSGSLMLMLLGGYNKAIEAVSNISKFNFNNDDLWYIIVLGVGVLVGFVVVSKLLKVWYEKNRKFITNFVSGLVIGSLVPIAQRFRGDANIFTGLLSILSGFLVVFLIERVALKMSRGG